MLDLDVSGLFDAFLSHTHEAVTIARRVAIGTYIADARVIAATPAAVAWYGLEEPMQLLGRWLSLLHHPEDNRLARALATARYTGLQVPTAYVSRIWQAQAPGTFRAVQKQTLQLTLEGETYWITRLTAPQETPLVLQQEVQQYLHLPTTPGGVPR